MVVSVLTSVLLTVADAGAVLTVAVADAELTAAVLITPVPLTVADAVLMPVPFSNSRAILSAVISMYCAVSANDTVRVIENPLK